jgi:hypothetical protein
LLLFAFACAGCGRIGFDALTGSGSGTPGDSGSTGDGGVRRTLKLDKVAPSITLVDFPLLVVLDDTRADRTLFAPAAADLRFYDSAGNVLAHELEQSGVPGGAPLIAWVRVPQIAGLTTTIEMRYGAPPTDTSAQSTWSSDYIAVWHFAADGDAHDSTGQFDATAVGSTVQAGFIGSAVTLAGTAYLAVPNTTSITPAAFTISGWGRPTSLPVGSYYALLAREVGATSDDDFYLGIENTGVLATCERTNTELDAFGGSPPAGQWAYFAGTADSTTVRAFLNGLQVGTAAVGGALQSDPSPIFIGADANGGGTAAQNDFFQGQIDELRLQSIARPQSWFEYEVASMRDLVISY